MQWLVPNLESCSFLLEGKQVLQSIFRGQYIPNGNLRAAVPNGALAGLGQDLCAKGWAERGDGNGAAQDNFTAQS